MDYSARDFYDGTTLLIDFTPHACVDGGQWDVRKPTVRAATVLPSGDVYSWWSGSDLPTSLQPVSFDVIIKELPTDSIQTVVKAWRLLIGRNGTLTRTGANTLTDTLTCWLDNIETIEQGRNDAGDWRWLRFTFTPGGDWT